jgi:hypothetical protein
MDPAFRQTQLIDAHIRKLRAAAANKLFVGAAVN